MCTGLTIRRIIISLLQIQTVYRILVLSVEYSDRR